MHDDWKVYITTSPRFIINKKTLNKFFIVLTIIIKKIKSVNLNSLARLGEPVLLWLSLRLVAGEGLIPTLLKLCTLPVSLCWFNCCWWCCALLKISLSFLSVSFSKDSPESGQTDAKYCASNACSPTRNCLPRPWEYSHSAFKLSDHNFK